MTPLTEQDFLVFKRPATFTAVSATYVVQRRQIKEKRGLKY